TSPSRSGPSWRTRAARWRAHFAHARPGSAGHGHTRNRSAARPAPRDRGSDENGTHHPRTHGWSRGADLFRRWRARQRGRSVVETQGTVRLLSAVRIDSRQSNLTNHARLTHAAQLLELLGCIEVRRRIRHWNADQAIAITLQHAFRAHVTAQACKIGEAPAWKNCRYAHRSRVQRRDDRSVLSLPCRRQAFEIVTRYANLIGEHYEDRITSRWKRRHATADRCPNALLPISIHDHGSGRMLEQHCQFLRVRTHDHGYCVAGDSDRMTDHRMQQWAPVQAHKLLGLSEAGRRPGCKNQDVQARACGKISVFHN